LGGNCDAWGFVGIAHPNGYITQYGHLSSIIVGKGAAVTQGQIIGYTGNTSPQVDPAKQLGPHLHFEVLKPWPGEFPLVIDPYGWTGAGVDPLYSASKVAPQRLWQ
jgi:murein DD-endopeptidase MepM/ murein hydrolase activator NlpD